MAITQFIENLADAINAGNRSKVASLLSSATAANWSAAGTDISYVLTDLSRSRLSAADKANFAKTIVEKGTVRSDDLAEVLFEFIGSRNFSAAHATLTAATKGELQSDPRFYGDLLQEVSRSELTAAQQAELARLIVTKTTVDSDSLVEAVFGFIGNNNYVAAHASLNGAAAAELKSDPRFYGDLLQEVSRSELTAEQQTELAKLIVTKTTVNSDDLVEALFGFVGNSNYTAAFHTLNSAAAAELKSDPRFYGDLLQEVSRSELTPAQQAWLAKTIVTKTIVNSDDLVEAAFGFIGNNNYAAVYHTLSSAAAGELTSDPRFYGDLLQEVSRSELTAAQQVEIAKLIVAKTTVDSDNLVEAVFGFVGNNNFHAASATLNAAGTNELKSDPRFYGDLLQEVSRSELTAAQQAELARLIVTKTTVDSSYLADALYGFMEMRNTGAVNTIMLNASAAEKAQFTAELHSELAKFGYKAGHDIVKDTAGNDVLYGYNGNDTLYGGFGRDTLTGGKGSDRFVLSDKVFRDTITDFSVAEKDVLILSKSLFSKSVADIDKAIDDFVIARTSGNDTIISIDADGKGAGKAVDVALLQNVKGIDVDVLHNKGIIDIA